jgi:hypothetical protein
MKGDQPFCEYARQIKTKEKLINLKILSAAQGFFRQNGCERALHKLMSRI